MVTLGLAPVVISLAMVLGVFLARWSLPALLRGTAAIGADVRQAPHLIVWAVLAGCLWAVANTLTIFAIRDIGLSIAFPLRSEEHTSELQSRLHLVCRLLLEKKKNQTTAVHLR